MAQLLTRLTQALTLKTYLPHNYDPHNKFRLQPKVTMTKDEKRHPEETKHQSITTRIRYDTEVRVIKQGLQNNHG